MIDATTAIPADEIRLAQLACAKLAGLLQGTLSIGLPALVTGVPDPRTFLEERFRVMSGFAIVLHSISAKSGSQQETLRLRDRSGEVSRGLEDLRRHLLDHLDPSVNPPLTYQSARDSASTVCDALAEYGDLLELDRSHISKVKAVILAVCAGVEDMRRVAETASR
jgi:hypothetical protein